MNKEQLQQKVANMEAELAEMKILLNKPEPTINYWQPIPGDIYYYIDQHIKVICTNYCKTKEGDTRYKVFQTKVEAQKYADYIKAEETLRKAIAEANKGWLPDWNTYYESKIVITINSDILNIRDFKVDKYLPNFMYIKSEQLAKQLMEKYKQEFITYLSY